MKKVSLEMQSDPNLIYREKMMNFQKMPIGPTQPMKITFEVNQIGFDSIDNYKDFDIDLNQGRAKKEIQTLLRSYK